MRASQWASRGRLVVNVGCSLPVGDEDGYEDVWYAVWAWVSNRGRARWVWTAVVLWVGSECGNEYRDAAVGREAGASVDDLVRSSTSDRTDEWAGSEAGEDGDVAVTTAVYFCHE